MNWRIVGARAPILLALAVLLTAIVARSSLARLLPFEVTAFPALAYLFLVLLFAFAPALLVRQGPLGATAVVTVPVLVVAAYGASRLDWLRLLKDFGVSEGAAIDPLRLSLSALAMLLLWTLHAVDLAVRMRTRAIERGIDVGDAGDAATRSLARSARAAGLAIAGAAGLLAVGIGGLVLGNAIPTQRGALIAPLLAAALLVGAGIFLARSRAVDR